MDVGLPRPGPAGYGGRAAGDVSSTPLALFLLRSFLWRWLFFVSLSFLPLLLLLLLFSSLCN